MLDIRESIASWREYSMGDIQSIDFARVSVQLTSENNNSSLEAVQIMPETA